MRRAIAALLVLTAVSVYFSYRPKLQDLRESLPMEVRHVPTSTQAAYGPATWRLLDLRVTDRLRTDDWVAAAPPTGAWVVARFTYHLDTAPPNDYWCEVTFTDADHRLYDPQIVTIAGQDSSCTGDEKTRPRVGTDFAFTVAALVPKESAERIRPRVTVRTRFPQALVFG